VDGYVSGSGRRLGLIYRLVTHTHTHRSSSSRPQQVLHQAGHINRTWGGQRRSLSHTHTHTHTADFIPWD